MSLSTLFSRVTSSAPSVRVGVAALWATAYGWAQTLASGATRYIASSSTQPAIVDVGTYTPIATAVANLDAVTPSIAQYSRTNNVVTVSGYVTVDPTLITTATQFRMTLPISSSLTSDAQCCGVGAAPLFGESAGILGDATNDAAAFYFVSGSAASHVLAYIYSYQIL